MTDLDHLSRATQAALSPLTGLAKFEAHVAFDRATQPAAIAEMVEEMRALREDAARLDYLDVRNDRKNQSYKTTYGWGLTENHNRIALEDHHFPVLSVREAIDAARAKEKT